MQTLSELGRPAEILMVEDDYDDVELTRASFDKAGYAVNVSHVDNGEKCLAYLKREGEYKGAVRPDLILLDINLPVLDGRATLAAMKSEKNMLDIPVIVLTTSSSSNDVVDMYRNHCAAYLVKPLNFGKFQESIRQLTEFWFTQVVLPN